MTKIRFTEYVLNELEAGIYWENSRSYHWFTGDGVVYHNEFTLYLYKKWYFKKVAKLSRKVSQTSSIYIPLTKEEVQKLWEYNDKLIASQKQTIIDAEKRWKEKVEKASWWP